MEAHLGHPQAQKTQHQSHLPETHALLAYPGQCALYSSPHQGCKTQKTARYKVRCFKVAKGLTLTTSDNAVTRPDTISNYPTVGKNRVIRLTGTLTQSHQFLYQLGDNELGKQVCHLSLWCHATANLLLLPLLLLLLLLLRFLHHIHSAYHTVGLLDLG
jgi:hypothetical protein